jgi:hypothetical protein
MQVAVTTKRKPEFGGIALFILSGWVLSNRVINTKIKEKCMASSPLCTEYSL